MAEKTDVEKIVEELKAMGYDARLLSGETVTLPFYENYVPCGVPNDVGDAVESTITTNAELIGNLSICVLIAKGDSMIDCGIFDGDYLYVEPRQDVSDGNIVLASIDNEMTVKVFFEDEDGNKWLVPQNDDYDPILLNDKLNVRILGRLVHTVHYVKSISFKDCKRRVAKSHKRMNAYISSEMEADHKQAWSKGGKTELANGQMLCEECNRKKSDGKLTVINVHGDTNVTGNLEIGTYNEK